MLSLRDIARTSKGVTGGFSVIDTFFSGGITSPVSLRAQLMRAFMTDRLQPMQRLNMGDQLLSQNQWVRLDMQGDGNLVLYRVQSRQPLWASSTDGQPVTHVDMQGDGDLVAYAADGTPFWASNTAGHPGASLVLQDDGNLVIYDPAGAALWASDTVVNWNTPTIGYKDSNGYEYVETSESWQKMCSELPCFDALQWPGYDSIHLDIEINSEPVVIQLWKGWCQKFLGLQFFPGGIGAEVGVYRRIPGKLRPDSLPFLPDWMEAFILEHLADLTDEDLWWPAPDLRAQLEFTFINPDTLSAGWRLAGPERLPFGRPGDLPQGSAALLECQRSPKVSRNSSTRRSGPAAGVAWVAPTAASGLRRCRAPVSAARTPRAPARSNASPARGA